MSASESALHGVIPEHPAEGLIPTDYGSGVLIRTKALQNPEKYTALGGKEKILTFLRGAMGDSAALRAISMDGDPHIAKTIWDSVGYKNVFKNVSASYIDSEDRIKDTTAAVLIAETLFMSLPYQEAMQFLLKLYDNTELIDDFIKKRVKADPEFRKAFENDPLYRFLLVHARTYMASAFPEIADLPLSDQAQRFIFNDICLSLGFKNLPLTPEQQDLVNIHRLLTNPQLMLKQLDKLETALKIAITERWHQQGLERPTYEASPKGMVSDYHFFTKPYPKEPDRPFLFSFFQTWAIENGFKELISLRDEASHEAFIAFLQEKTLFKDPAFGGSFHGAWTHLVQWYCITAAASDKDILLENAPHALLKYMADHGGPNNDLWNTTLESAIGNIMHRKPDFRDVNFFNNFLSENRELQERCPTLHALIKYRNLRDEENSAAKFTS